MPTRITWRILLIAGLLLPTIALSGCNLPAFAEPSATPTREVVQPSKSPSSTAAAPTHTFIPLPTTTVAEPTASPTKATTPSTKTPTKIQTVSRTPTFTSTPPKSLYSGFIAYDRTNETISGYDFKGTYLNIKLKVNGAEWIGFNEAQWANNSIYYVQHNSKSVVQIVSGGAAQKLSFIPARDSLHFSISPNGKKIAWSFDIYSTTNPASELWIADINGSNAKKIAQVNAAGNSKWEVLQPYRWLDDRRLLYVDAPTGIGGYILFYGFAGFHLYNLADGKTTNLTPGKGAGGLCLREISPELKVVLSTCAGNNESTLYRVTLGSDAVSAIQRQTDQNQVGSPAYSPSGDWLAYAFARGNADNEQGKVALVTDSGVTPKILATITKGYYNVNGWINENQMLATRFEGDVSSVWLISREGGAPSRLALGQWISWIP